MKCSSVVITLLGVGVLLNSCDKSTPTPVDQIPSSQDTLVRNLTPGIKVCLENIQDSYAFGTSIAATIKTINVSDTSAFVIHTSSYPPYMWIVSLADQDSLIAYNSAFGYMVYDDTLRVGDTTSFTFNWRQTFVSTNPDIDGDPVPSGKYKLTVSMRGNALFQPVFKKFTIE